MPWRDVWVNLALYEEGDDLLYGQSGPDTLSRGGHDDNLIGNEG